MKTTPKFIATTLIILSFITTLKAGDSPLDLIKARNQTVEKILQQAGDDIDDATRTKLKDMINGFIDFQELSKRALGKHWDARSKEEQKEFVEVFQQLIRNSSVKKLEVYEADRMVYAEPVIENGQAEVVTTAYKKRRHVEIVYHMHIVNDEWKVCDMEIDGVSTAENYRESFYRQISKTSYAEMYDKLVNRLESGS